MTVPGRVLIGGIGYRNLRDYSAGVAIIERLTQVPWPAHVLVEDISYGPIAVVQRLEDDPPDRRFARAILVSSVTRPGRDAGAMVAYRWDGALPSAQEIQRSVTEGITGIIALDNTLVIARHFQALPSEVVVVEIEPEAHEFGDAMTPAVQQAVDAACELISHLALDRIEWTRVPEAPLGGGYLSASGLHVAPSPTGGVSV